MYYVYYSVIVTVMDNHSLPHDTENTGTAKQISTVEIANK